MRLKDLILRMIAADGPMPLDRYMSLCLTHPDHGYYMKGEPIGARGAFTTAPEISQMFGELLGAWSHAVWQSLGHPGKVYWVELGPGRGALAADAVRVMQRDSEFCAAAEAILIDLSPILKSAQQTALKDSKIQARWLERLDELPTDAPLILVANEVFDALPVRQAIRGQIGWHERVIAAKDGALTWGARSDLLPPQAIPADLRDASPGAIAEFSPARQNLARDIADRIRTQGGAAIIIDYGYGRTQTGDTLQALDPGGRADPLATPGQADVTAHVDFQALRESALGARVHGPVGQGDFLRALGIAERAARLSSANPDKQHEIAAALHRLTHPDAMGDLFKAIAICHENAPPPPGF